jgi:CHAD domain-containing protein
MAYRIDFDNPLGDEVRRIASELLKDAIDVLEKQPGGPHEAIHEARKNIKRTRALYRLISSEARDFAAAEDTRLRDIARELSHLRDSAALAETTDYLERESSEKHAKTAIRRLGRSMKKRRDTIAGKARQIEEKLAVCCAGLRDASAALKHLDLPRLRKQSIDCIAAGWRKTGKKACKALSSCQHTDDEEAFHDLRKRAQDRFMHAALLYAIWPSGMTSIQRQAKALVSFLGHEHDLAVLNEEVLGRTDDNAGEREKLLQSIAMERLKLQQSAREVGQDIFDGKPKRDAEIIAFLIKNRS